MFISREFVTDDFKTAGAKMCDFLNDCGIRQSEIVFMSPLGSDRINLVFSMHGEPSDTVYVIENGAINTARFLGYRETAIGASVMDILMDGHGQETRHVGDSDIFKSRYEAILELEKRKLQ